MRNSNKDSTDKINKLTKRIEEFQNQIVQLNRSDTDSQEDVASPDGSILNDQIDEAHNLDEVDLDDDEVKISEEQSTPKSAKTIISNLENLVRSSKTEREELVGFNRSLNVIQSQTPDESVKNFSLNKIEQNESNEENLLEENIVSYETKNNFEENTIEIDPESIQEPEPKTMLKTEPQPGVKPKELKLNEEEMKESINQTQQMNVQVKAKKKELEVLSNTKAGPIKVENEDKREKTIAKPRDISVKRVPAKEKRRETSSDIREVLQPKEQTKKVISREKNSTTPLNSNKLM